MKINQTCPKCNANVIIRVPGTIGPDGTGFNIMVGKTIFSSVKVTRYICSHCGFIEEWIDNKDDLEKIVKKYK